MLYELAPEIDTIAHSRITRSTVIDEFVRGLADNHRIQDCPIWLVVACQIYLDMYDLLGTHIEHGVQALQSTFQRYKRIAEDLEGYRIESISGMHDVSNALSQVTWVADAATVYANAMDLAPSDDQAVVKAKLGCSTSTMDSKLPAHAGAIMTDLKIGMLDAGLKIANHGAFVLSMAHLYRFLRNKGALKSDWPDMDFVCASVGSNQPLVAKLAAQADDDAAYRHYLTALGVTAAEFARSSQGLSETLYVARNVSVTSPYLRAMVSRQQAWGERGLGYSKTKAVEVVLNTIMTNEEPCASGGSISRSGPSSQRVTPLQLLTTFRRSILADEPQLNFDYASFAISCSRLFKTIDKQPSGDSCSTAFIVRVLRDASVSSQESRHAAAVLQVHIAGTGKSYLKSAYDRSSGCIPKALRPQIENDHAAIAHARKGMSAMLGISGTHYVFSGRTMAAYHPLVKPEGCTNKCCPTYGGGGETDPDGAGDKIIAHGAALPKAVVEQSLAGARNNPAKVGKIYEQLINDMIKEHARGLLSDDQLCSKVLSVTGSVLVRKDIPGRVPWWYQVGPGHKSHTGVMELFRARDMAFNPKHDAFIHADYQMFFMSNNILLLQEARRGINL